jgi:hypothetical protein
MQEETGYHYSKHLLRGYPTNRPKKKAGLTLVIRNEKKKIIQHYPEDATRCSCGGTGAAWLAPPGAPDESRYLAFSRFRSTQSDNRRS